MLTRELPHLHRSCDPDALNGVLKVLKVVLYHSSNTGACPHLKPTACRPCTMLRVVQPICRSVASLLPGFLGFAVVQMDSVDSGTLPWLSFASGSLLTSFMREQAHGIVKRSPEQAGTFHAMSVVCSMRTGGLVSWWEVAKGCWRQKV